MLTKNELDITPFDVYVAKQKEWREYYVLNPLIAKRLMDIVLSFLIMAVFSPVILITALLIKSTSYGPVLYKQERVGFMGHKFTIYKFRTMIHNAESLIGEVKHLNEADGPTFKIENDPRITKIGKVFRKTGLDELPQLINILKGEMSLVGPRPPLYDEVVKYEQWQLKRLSVKPGLTCLWQIQPERNKIKFDEWMKLDLHYIDNWSLGLDVKILLKTANTVLERSGL